MNPENKATIHQLLKNQTLELHIKAHKIPYIANLLLNDIPLISYIGHLRALAIIYGTLEYQLFHLKNPSINVFLENYTPKLPFIMSDLDLLKAQEIKDIIPAINIALSVADKILLNSIENPNKLLGYLYILDGSLNGGSILKKHLVETFNFQNNDGTTYFSCFDENFKNFWDSFINKLNSNFTENNQIDDILDSANEIFHALIQIYDGLYPVDEKDLAIHITSLNPEAGNFPITTNPLEITAAIRAGMLCWNKFPYFEKRYGERGRRFGASDSVWLVNLCELTEEHVIKQVTWLSNFLAIRGMPTYTMEIQLQSLYSELTKAIPESKPKYNQLFHAVEYIKNQRINYLDDGYFENCNAIFEKYFEELKVSDKNCIELKPNIGKLIASSIIDDMNGIPDVRQSLESWLKCKEEFPDNWILAVENSFYEIELHIAG